MSRHAGLEDIKRAYRQLVRQCHPDLHPGPAAARRFKAVSAAYAVLSDAQQRALFDEFGVEALQPGFDPIIARQYGRRQPEPPPPTDSPFGDMGAFHDVMSSAFHAEPGARPDDSWQHGTTSSGPERVVARIEPLITFTGGMTTVMVRRASGRQESLRVRVKAGARSGDEVVLSGMGTAPRGAPPQDLVVELEVPDHPTIRRKGDDLEMDVPITLLEAVQGGPVTVPTPTGPKRVNLPPNCAGARLRLRGRGVQRPERPGHLILHLRPELPDQVDPSVVEACRVIERAYRGDLRDRIRL